MLAPVVRLQRHLDMSLSRVVFGNLAGFSNNADGMLKSGMRQLRSLLPAADAAPPETVALRRDGFVKIEPPCQGETIRSIAAKFSAAIEDDRYSVGRASASARHNGQFFSRALRDARILLPDLEAVIDDQLVAILTAHYGGNFAVRDFIAWRNYAPPRDVSDAMEVYSDRWHCDRISGKILKYFILLHPVDETHGPLHLQSRRRTRELLAKGFGSRTSYNLPLDVLEDPKHVVRFTGPAGGRTLCSTVRCLHKAGYPADGKVRDIIQIQFEPSDRPFDRGALARTVASDPDKVQLMQAGTAGRA